MKLFKCKACHLLLFFENKNCERCAHTLGYSPERNDLIALDKIADGIWKSHASETGMSYKFCENEKHNVCNWLLPSDSPETFCKACRHNRFIPNLSDQEYVWDWQKMELAKHHLFYTLLQLNLPLQNRLDNPESGLVFDFLADATDGPKILTGHDNGIITLALKEADDAERESRRMKLGEFYRTLLGHFRHEIGHYYWDRLVKDKGREEEFRVLFGDERVDYNETLDRHYKEGPPINWQQDYISAYATMHPWEDFAETWAHYLHIVDSLETSTAFGLEVHPDITTNEHLHVEGVLNPYKTENFRTLIDNWVPLTYALNAMNRSMGYSDLYPFVLTTAVIAKLTFIHKIVHSAQDWERPPIAA